MMESSRVEKVSAVKPAPTPFSIADILSRTTSSIKEQVQQQQQQQQWSSEEDEDEDEDEEEEDEEEEEDSVSGVDHPLDMRAMQQSSESAHLHKYCSFAYWREGDTCSVSSGSR